MVQGIQQGPQGLRLVFSQKYLVGTLALWVTYFMGLVIVYGLVNWMPVLFTFMLANMPAGLVIYWTWNNFLSILQQYLIMRKHGVKVELWDNIKSLWSKQASGK